MGHFEELCGEFTGIVIPYLALLSLLCIIRPVAALTDFATCLNCVWGS